MPMFHDSAAQQWLRNLNVRLMCLRCIFCVCIENAFDPQWVSHGRRAVAAAISTAAKSALREDHVVNEGKGLFFFDTFLWRRLPSFRQFTFESPAARLAKKVMRSKELLLYFDMAIVKEPGTTCLWIPQL